MNIPKKIIIMNSFVKSLLFEHLRGRYHFPNLCVGVYLEFNFNF